MLLRWPKKTESQTRQTARETRQSQPDRQRADRESRQRDSQTDRTDGPGGPRTARLAVSLIGKEGRGNPALPRGDWGAASGAKRREQVAGLVDPVRDSLGGTGKYSRIGHFF